MFIEDQTATAATLEQPATAPETPETPDTLAPADAIELDAVETDYVDGVLMEFGMSKGLRPRPYARIQPTDKGASAATVYGVPQGRLSGIPVGTFARFYLVPNGTGNNFVYAGHDLIDRKSVRVGAKKASLQSKGDALAAIEARDKAVVAAAKPKAKVDV